MKWTPEAEAAAVKVPFFVRKRVRARVEREAAAENKAVVTLAEVQATQARYLNAMPAEVRGYQLDTCFGPGGCPNRAHPADRLMERIEALLRKEDLLGFLRQRVQGGLKFHHEFRVTLAECPNACSQPQIKDIGIIGACIPQVTAAACSGCGACETACREGAVFLGPGRGAPGVNGRRCLGCGACIPVCPTGILAGGRRGYRVQVGGKLGRHPALALEFPGLYDEDETLGIVAACLAFYKARSRRGERFAEIVQAAGLHALIEGSGCLRELTRGR